MGWLNEDKAEVVGNFNALFQEKVLASHLRKTYKILTCWVCLAQVVVVRG